MAVIVFILLAVIVLTVLCLYVPSWSSLFFLMILAVAGILFFNQIAHLQWLNDMAWYLK